MKLYDHEISSNAALMQLLIKKGVIADGQIGKEITQALIKEFPLDKNQDGTVCLETQQIEEAERLGAWQALTKSAYKQSIQPGGLLYVVQAHQTGPKDVVRFTTAIDQMSVDQIKNSLLVFPNGQADVQKNPFATTMSEISQDYGVSVGFDLNDYVDQE